MNTDNSPKKRGLGNKTLTYKNKVIFKEIQLIHKNEEIRSLKEKLNQSNIMGVEIIDTGNFRHKNKILTITTNSNAGKFFEVVLRDKNHYISDLFCVEKFQISSTDNTRNIVRDLKKYLKKDNLIATFRRSGDPSGYILEEIKEEQ